MITTPENQSYFVVYVSDDVWQVRQQIDSYSILIDCFKDEDKADELRTSLQKIEDMQQAEFARLMATTQSS